MLEAQFDFDILARDRIVWHLPRDSSSLLIDPDTFDGASEVSCKKRVSKFERAIAAHSPTDALHCFAVSFDEALARSSVTTTGDPSPVPRSYLGPCRGPLFRRVRARQGEYQCTVLQPDHDLRLKVKQVRWPIWRNRTPGPPQPFVRNCGRPFVQQKVSPEAFLIGRFGT